MKFALKLLVALFCISSHVIGTSKAFTSSTKHCRNFLFRRTRRIHFYYDCRQRQYQSLPLPTKTKTTMNSLPLHLSASTISNRSYFSTRVVFVRALAFVYGVAFLVAKHQNRALIGDNGITPARTILNKAQKRGTKTRQRRDVWLNSNLADKPPVVFVEKTTKNHPKNIWIRLKNSSKIRQIGMRINRNEKYKYWRERLWDRSDGMGRPITTLMWLAKDRNKLNPWLDGIANAGFITSLLCFVLGAANVPLMISLWLCQRSLMAVGGPFYGYGWEPQLAELGFHAIFLVPFLSLKQIEASSPPSRLVLYAIRFYLFKIMLGAGLIKIRSGDLKWKWPHLTAMDYFYETQPVPNPLTRVFHFTPTLFHKFEVLMNHFVELIAPWLLLLPICRLRRLGGTIQIAFQALLISSGNLSFLNWLTAVPAITCFDDAFLARLFPFSSSKKSMVAAIGGTATMSATRWFVSVIFAIVIGILNIPVVKNLMSTRQLMNASFDPLRLAGTYGAFGNVNEVREEFIVSATSDLDKPWKEYHFKVKPGDVMRKPRFLSPYHYRLDWQFWIAAVMKDVNRSPWIYSFLLKLLEEDPDVLGLLEGNPFERESDRPKYIRIDKYKYRFVNKTKTSTGDKQQYWTREFVGRILPSQGLISAEDLRPFVGDED